MNFGKIFKKKGYLIVDQILNENQLKELRADLSKEFNDRKTFVIFLHQLKNKSLAFKILSLFKNDKLKTQLNSLKEYYGKNASLLPRFEIVKNYHVNLKENLGWHRDCGGELRYKYLYLLKSKFDRT